MSSAGRSEAAPTARPQGELKLIGFELGGQAFALPITQVKETIVLRPLTRVFLTPPWLAGLINLRGDVVAVIDLAAFLALGRTRPSDETRVVIAWLGGRKIGVLVDRLRDSLTVDAHALAPPPPTLAADAAELTMGVVTNPAGPPVCVIDIERLLDSQRLKAARHSPEPEPPRRPTRAP
jgi:purine-binding chemotaxis protein CheW